MFVISFVAALAAAAPVPVQPGAGCELHVWPTRNYLAMNTGLLVGLGPVGAVADMAGHKNRVMTVKDLMADYLPPEQQVAALETIGIAKTLGRPGYSVIVEGATPSGEGLKQDPARKALLDAMNAKLKSGQRLSASTNSCYAELIATNIFYHKAMMYGSNLFGGWIFRTFDAGPVATRSFAGAVKNPLENFPPKTPEDVTRAQAELRDAYARDFAEYVAKKVKL